MRWVVACVCLLVATAHADEPPTPSASASASPSPGVLDGVVLDRQSGAPLPDVTVRLSEIAREVITDARGAFAFPDLPPADYTVEIAGRGLQPARSVETVASGLRRTVRYTVAQRSRGVYESVVRSGRPGREVAETSLRAEEARRAAGTQGDPLKVVESLPGVSRSPAGAGQLIVWGAAPADTRVYVDGVEVPALYHVGGVRSVLSSELVRDVQLSPGAYGAGYGRGLGGVVRVETRALPERGVHGYVGVDLLDAAALVSARLHPWFAIAAALRIGYLDRILGGVLSTDAADLYPIPRYDDYQVKASLRIGPGEELSAVLLAADDRLTRTVGAADPAARRSELLSTSTYRAYLRYTRNAGAGSATTITPFFGYDTTARRAQFGAIPTQLDTSAYRYGLRASLRQRLARRLHVTAGVDLLGSRTEVARAGSATLPPREGDPYVFGQAPGADLRADRYGVHVLDAAAYVTGEIELKRFTITPGLRLPAVLLDVDRVSPLSPGSTPRGARRLDIFLEPRLDVVFRPHSRVDLMAAAGIYHQAPDPLDLGPVFGNPTLAPSRALHGAAGLRVRLGKTLYSEALGFFRQLDDLVVRDARATPPVGQSLAQEGTGRSFGGQLVLRQEAWHGLSGWISYALSRSERRDHPDAPWRAFDYDQTHVLTAVVSYAFYGFHVGARLRFASGMPRTPVLGGYFESTRDRFEPIFGAVNTTRLPDFFQLDLRVDRTFHVGPTTIELYLDVLNATAQRNAEEIVYGSDFRSRGYLTGLPILAVLGARMVF